MIPHADLEKPATNWAKGPDGKWKATVWCWSATAADGKHLQYCSHVTKWTPKWCRRHKWASDHVCCPRIEKRP